MSGASNRQRGHNAERAVVTYLRLNGYPLAATSRSMLGHDGARQLGGDVFFHPAVALEVKDVAASAWPTWLRQADRQAGPYRIAAVIRRLRGTVDVGMWETRWLPIDGIRPPIQWKTCLRGDAGGFVAPFHRFIELVKDMP